MPRYRALALAFAFAAACGGGNRPPGSGQTSPIDAPTAAALTGSLGQASAVAGLPTASAVAAKAAALAIESGVQVSDVTISASVLAGTPGRAALTSGAAKAFGFQLQVLHLAGSGTPQTFSGVLLFQGGSDWVLVAGPSPGGPFPEAVGLIGSGGQLWEATAGQESAQLQTQGGACTGTVPAIVTSCSTASFGGAGLSITSSAPASSGATGSKTAALPPGPLSGGVVLRIDCNLGTCLGSSSGGATCDSPSPCTGTLNGNPFACDNGFAQYSGPLPDGGSKTTLRLSSVGITGMSFVGLPPSEGSPTPVMLLPGDSVFAFGHGNLPDGGGVAEPFEALIGPQPLGSITVEISGAKPRDGGTPGDYCVDGTLSATLVDTLWIFIDAGVDAGHPPQPNMQMMMTF